MKLNLEEKEVENKLIEKCQKAQGEYLPSHHGSGSWATTYSTQFIDAAALLILLYRENSSFPLQKFSSSMINAGIRSCRGSVMEMDKTKYLYDSHVKSAVEKLEKDGYLYSINMFRRDASEHAYEWLSMAKVAVSGVVFKKIKAANYSFFQEFVEDKELKKKAAELLG